MKAIANTNINFNGKINIKRTSLFNNNKICQFEIKHPDFKDILKLKTKIDISGDVYTSSIINKSGHKLAYENFTIDKKEKKILGKYIHTLENYQKKNLAEILRLASIITMLENGVENLKIFSFFDKIPFHSKYKFEADIASNEEALQILKHISHSYNEKLAISAKNLIKKYEKISEDEFCYRTEKLLKLFFKDYNSKENSNNDVHVNMIQMNLTKDKVFDNRDFFNDLFKKHDIDYQI